MGRAAVFLLIIALLNSPKAMAQLSLKSSSDTLEKKISIRPLPQNFYKQTSGYFCKKEWQLQKTLSLPLYIRLGSKDYVDYLEKKPNSHPFNKP